MNSTNSMIHNNSTTNLECDLTIDEQPMPPPPPPSGIEDKDEEIEELKQVVVKLQEQVKDCEMKLEKANARITERNTNPKEVCITELTNIMEDILSLYPDGEANQIQTNENLYKHNWKHINSATRFIRGIIDYIEMFNHPRSFCMLKLIKDELESIGWEERHIDACIGFNSRHWPMRRVVKKSSTYVGDNKCAAFIQKFILDGSQGGILVVYETKMKEYTISKYLNDYDDPRYNFDRLNYLKITYADRATKALLDYVNASFEEVKKTMHDSDFV